MQVGNPLKLIKTGHRLKSQMEEKRERNGKALVMMSKTHNENGGENCEARKTHKGSGGRKKDAPGKR